MASCGTPEVTVQVRGLILRLCPEPRVMPAANTVNQVKAQLYRLVRVQAWIACQLVVAAQVGVAHILRATETLSLLRTGLLSARRKLLSALPACSRKALPEQQPHTPRDQSPKHSHVSFKQLQVGHRVTSVAYQTGRERARGRPCPVCLCDVQPTVGLGACGGQREVVPVPCAR